MSVSLSFTNAIEHQVLSTLLLKCLFPFSCLYPYSHHLSLDTYHIYQLVSLLSSSSLFWCTLHMP
jgi:hypothetical protein